MTGDEFSAARAQLNLTQAALGKLLSISTSSIRRLEERQEVPRTIALAMRSLRAVITEESAREALALAPELIQTAYNECALRQMGQHQAAQAAKEHVRELLKRMSSTSDIALRTSDSLPDPNPTTETDPEQPQIELGSGQSAP